jgi:hypothetical protein
VVGFYGANTWVPGQGRHWGFYVMLGVLIVGTCLVIAMLRARRGSRSQERSRTELNAQPALRR